MKSCINSLFKLLLILFLGSSLLACSTTSYTTSQISKRLKIPSARLKAPTTLFLDLNGQKRSLAEFRGQVIVVNFFSTWCRACKQELPSLERIWQDYQHQGLVVVGIIINESNRERVQRWAEDQEITFLIGMNTNASLRDRYNLVGTPTSYIIDGRGQVKGIVSGKISWDDDLIRHFMEDLLTK